MAESVTIVGAGLAGTECAFQLAERGIAVRLIEQKPKARTPAQTGDGMAELVCSNSFRGEALSNAVGLLKEELRRAGSLVMSVGETCRVPAGGAMAVDRERFSSEMTRRIAAHPRITCLSELCTELPQARPLVLATGPLTGDALAADLARAIGSEHLAYYDSIAPIVAADSIDWEQVFQASRYDKGGDDAYVNCPLDRAQYEAFVTELRTSTRVAPHAFEEPRYFEGCLPIEVMADRGPRTLAFGPMKPVGLTDPRTGKWPYAVVQLRREDAAGTAYNMVGFQTRMTQPEQRRVFGMIPGLGQARYERYGTVHRNTFVDAPRVLTAELELRALAGVYLAGQISGVEGYVESAACGLCLGILLGAKLTGRPVAPPPLTTALGSLLGHLQRPHPDFQPSNVVFSMFPAYAGKRLGKRDRHLALAERALRDLDPWLESIGLPRAGTHPAFASDAAESSASESDVMRALVPESVPRVARQLGLLPPSATMSEVDEKQPFLPRWAMYALVPGLIGPVLILGFIFVTQLAYDDARCPYEHAETRKLSADVAVREDRRSCLWDSEERRFSVVRADGQQTLGRRRFRSDAFRTPGYHWQAELLSDGQVRVSVHNDGHADAAFREGSAKERAQ